MHQQAVKEIGLEATTETESSVPDDSQRTILDGSSTP